jgi:hypothetical protein
LARGGAKGQTSQEVKGHPGLGAVGGGGIEANYLGGSLKVGEVGVFQVEQGGGNGEGEDLTRLEGSGWIYMEIGAAQADVPEDAVTLERGVGIGQAGMESHREGDHNPAKPPSFPKGDHELTLK